jgi:hypothetical protein
MILFGTPHMRKVLKTHYKEFQAAFDRWQRTGYLGAPMLPVYPPECRGMACGAKNRKGSPCKNLSLYANGRCKFHGGPSTGPKTKAGKRKVAMNGQRAGKPHGWLRKPHFDEEIRDAAGRVTTGVSDKTWDVQVSDSDDFQSDLCTPPKVQAGLDGQDRAGVQGRHPSTDDAQF